MNRSSVSRHLRPSLKRYWNFARYVISGAMTLAIYLLILLALVEFAGLSHGVSAGIAMLLGGIANYLLLKHIVFSSTRRHIEAVPRYFAVLLANAAANAAVTWIASDLGGVPYGPVQVVYLGISTVTIYLVLKKKVMIRVSSLPPDNH